MIDRYTTGPNLVESQGLEPRMSETPDLQSGAVASSARSPCSYYNTLNRLCQECVVKQTAESATVQPNVIGPLRGCSFKRTICFTTLPFFYPHKDKPSGRPPFRIVYSVTQALVALTTLYFIGRYHVSNASILQLSWSFSMGENCNQAFL